MKRRQRFRGAAVALVIDCPWKGFLLVSRRNLITFPTEHFDREKGDNSLVDTARRCAREELHIGANDLVIKEWLEPPFLGTAPDGAPVTISIAVCVVTLKTAAKIWYEESGERRQVWSRLWRIRQLTRLDGLAQDVLTKYLVRHFCQRALIEVVALLDKLRRALWCKRASGRKGKKFLAAIK